MLLLIGGGWWGAFQRVYEANQAQQAGAAAYARRDYPAAAAAYARARELGSNSPQLHLDLGHAYARAGQAAAAREAYGRALQNAPGELRSVARQQLATLAAAEGNYPQALALLRQALMDNPRNAAARYNYELLRPYQGRRNPPQLPPPPPPPASGGGQQNQPNPNGAAQPTPAPDAAGSRSGGGGRPDAGQGSNRATGQGPTGGTERGVDASGEGSGAPSGSSPSAQAAGGADNRLITRQREQVTNLSEAQAQQLLDALQAAEQQYLQQIPHRATRRPDPRKPAW
ncbi:hypothetical protein EJV47_04470 [Hymenobacter gummosus]|uniref:Uncharacterized protein n=1 Tax=Hymenobacter gummosus TaxID=1776032 RepID=A0A3S0JCL3_9BACT|nr:hypothetical protein EJV47_04470 [Hymenobacter gummosus]